MGPNGSSDSLKPSPKRLLLLYLLPIPVLFLSLWVGPSRMFGWEEVIAHFFQVGTIQEDAGQQMLHTILWDIRLPRILLGFLIGGALSVSGCALQAMFRNPLVCPYILGLSSGAAFGAAVSIAIGSGLLQLFSFGFGILAVGASYLLARSRKTVSIVSLILSGVVVSGLFTALLTIVQYCVDPFKLQTIVHWTMGNLHTAGWGKLRSAAGPILVGTGILLLYRFRLNVIALGDEQCRSVGLHPEMEKFRMLVPATLAASASVAVAGVIGLVGLLVPHLVRMMIGPDNRRLVPASFCFGGMYLVLVDDLARSLASVEIPIGVFTNLIGGPFLIYLLRKERVGWQI